MPRSATTGLSLTPQNREFLRKMLLADQPCEAVWLGLGEDSRRVANVLAAANSSEECLASDKAEPVTPSDSSAEAISGVAFEELLRAAETTRPCILTGTRPELTALIGSLRENGGLRLPAGSRILVLNDQPSAGALSAKGIAKAAWRFAHIPAYHCVGAWGIEGGSAVFVDDCLVGRHNGALHPRGKTGPDWARARVLDEAGQPVAEGKTGRLRLWDLRARPGAAFLDTDLRARRSGAGFQITGRVD